MTISSLPPQHSLLQSVIRNLVDSEDDQERLTQRKKLEGDLVVASERLDDLVQGQQLFELGQVGCEQWVDHYNVYVCRTQR